MVADDLGHERKPKPRAVALGRHERVEQVRQRLRRDAAAAVGDADPRFLLVAAAGQLDGAALLDGMTMAAGAAVSVLAWAAVGAGVGVAGAVGSGSSVPVGAVAGAGSGLATALGRGCGLGLGCGLGCGLGTGLGCTTGSGGARGMGSGMTMGSGSGVIKVAITCAGITIGAGVAPGRRCSPQSASACTAKTMAVTATLERAE